MTSIYYVAVCWINSVYSVIGKSVLLIINNVGFTSLDHKVRRFLLEIPTGSFQNQTYFHMALLQTSLIVILPPCTVSNPTWDNVHIIFFGTLRFAPWLNKEVPNHIKNHRQLFTNSKSIAIIETSREHPSQQLSSTIFMTGSYNYPRTDENKKKGKSVSYFLHTQSMYQQLSNFR